MNKIADSWQIYVSFEMAMKCGLHTHRTACQMVPFEQTEYELLRWRKQRPTFFKILIKFRGLNCTKKHSTEKKRLLTIWMEAFIFFFFYAI